MRGFRWLAAILAALSITSAAHAVIIQDSTWRKEGGTNAKPWAGFGAHIKLANQPQFRSVLALSTDGETWGEASGIWIGNDAKHAYILTSGHIYTLPAKKDAYVVRTPAGETVTADKIWVHPDWSGSTDTHTGFDLVILRLPRPITNAGPQPALYDGTDELGKLITFVGFGSRGIGSEGQDARFYEGSDKAAAQGTVDEVVDCITPPNTDDNGNYLSVWLGREDGSLENPYGGANKPPTPYAGLLGSGDSGGAAFMQLAKDWVIVGVNSNGSGNAAYGDKSWFTRVSFQKPWITKIFPGAKFAR